MTLSQLETALARFVMAATGLATGQVYFTDQGQRVVPTGLRVAITIGDLPIRGQPELIRSFDGSAARGEEITEEQLSMGEVTITFQAYGPKDGITGDAGPRQLMRGLRSKLGLYTYREPLRVAGLGINTSGPVLWVPAIAGANFEARAVLEVMGSVSESAIEKFGYIQTMRVRGTVDGTALPPVMAQLSTDRVAYLGGDPITAHVVELPAPTVAIDVTVGP